LKWLSENHSGHCNRERETELCLHLLMEEPEVCVQILRADGTLADLKIDFWVVVHIVNTHFIADSKASKCNVVTVCSPVPAGCDECVPL